MQNQYRLSRNYGVSIPQEHVKEKLRYRSQSNRRQHTLAKEEVSFKLSRNLLQKIHRAGGDNSSQLTLFCWKMDVLFVVAVIESYSGLKLCSPFKTILRKKLLLSVCHCLDPKISLHEMNDFYTHGGLIGYGVPYLDSVLRFSKGFRLHAILLDAAGAVYTEKSKGPG